MNRLQIPGRIWIASDVHLGPDVPATAAAFNAFLEQAALRADTLILAGDIFNAWIGDDTALSPEPWLASALHALKSTANRIPLWLGRGNRDFLIGQQLVDLVGAQLLPEPVLLATDSGPVLLAHGDQYCTADPGYQRFRRLVRNPAVQRAYLALPLKARRGIADWARRRSMASNQHKAYEIMDVVPAAIEQALRDSQAPVLVHGHTHRPARHILTVDSRTCERLVLPDWDFDHAGQNRGGWVQIDSQGIQLLPYPPEDNQPSTGLR